MRKSGILLPLFSLNSPFAIGTLGECAFSFVDFLSDSRQYYWQILPIGPTAFSNSPYLSSSAFAGSPYYIDPQLLFEYGLLSQSELQDLKYNKTQYVDYSFLYHKALPIIKYACGKFKGEDKIEQFKEDNEFWLKEYCIYMALKERNNMKPLSRESKKDIPTLLKDESFLQSVNTQIKMQYIFFRQWQDLKKYANSKNVHIIGDLPIYVSADSSDFFFKNKLFKTDENEKMSEVSGCPPDFFNPQGQFWGSPVYNWQENENELLLWWKERIKQASVLFDAVRIDHFRAFFEYYSIAAKSSDASKGKWHDGPKLRFVQMIKENFPDLFVIAEDLGFSNKETRNFFKSAGFPGMKVLQFAFDEKNSEHLPHNHEKSFVCYTGTHDNPTTLYWICGSDKKTVNLAMDYFGAKSVNTLSEKFVKAALSSVCDTAVIPLQDYINSALHGRINTPGTSCSNWEYRISGDDLTDKLKNKILNYTNIYSRC